MDPSEVDAADFERFDQGESDRLKTRLANLIAGLRNAYLRRLGEAFLADEVLMPKLAVAAAAVSNHHAYPGGLLKHTVDLMEICQMLAPRYPQLDGDVLMFGAFLHDLGKIEEMTGGGEATYTNRGQLLGHLVIGVQMLDGKIRQLEKSSGEDFPADLRLHLEHLIVSHHGNLEFGSPKVPMTLEAITLHHIDNLDAKITSFTSLIEADVSADANWTNYHPSIGRKLWKPS
jgi:3'-5' exoribonuclease